jgi:DNA-binding MarR family transcriptional regulator
VVARLQESGLLERHSGSGKAILHRMTAPGIALLRHGDHAVAATMRAALSDFSDDEVRSLHNLLERLAQSVEGHAPVI